MATATTHHYSPRNHTGEYLYQHGEDTPTADTPANLYLEPLTKELLLLLAPRTRKPIRKNVRAAIVPDLDEYVDLDLARFLSITTPGEIITAWTRPYEGTPWTRTAAPFAAKG